MFDLALSGQTCQHVLFDQPVTINGTSPNYYSVLPVATDGSSNFIGVRNFATTEALSNYVYLLDGMTNWNLSFVNPQIINWNVLGIGTNSGAASFVDGSSMIFPAPQLLVTYKCNANFCPLCIDSANNNINDISFDQQGQLNEVTGNQKIQQEVYKALVTELGTNSIYPTYGSTLSDNIGQKFDTFTEFSVYTSVQQAITFLISQQANNPALPLDETILGIQSIGMVQNPQDPRIANVTINLKIGNFSVLPITISMVVS